MDLEVENAKFLQNSKFNLKNAYKEPQQKLRDSSKNPLVSRFVQIVRLCQNGDYKDAFAAQLKYTQDLIESFDYSSIRFLYIHLCNLLLIARIVDANENTTENVEVTTRCLMKAFNYALNDRAPLEFSRKWAVYAVLLLLFKSFIRLKTLNLIRNSLRAISNAQQLAFPSLDHHPKHISVGIKFFTAFYQFSNENYQDAFNDFLFAFENCHSAHVKNKLSCLKYLVPCALLNGYLPKDKLLSSYARNQHSRHYKDLISLMECYRELISAIRTGNYRRFHRNMETNENFYLTCGVYLILERVRTICLARLLKKMYLVMDKQTRIGMDKIVQALVFCGYTFISENQDDRMDECECLVATLIHQGLLRGYISHEKRMLVLSAVNPFPKYAEIVKKSGIPI